MMKLSQGLVRSSVEPLTVFLQQNTQDRMESEGAGLPLGWYALPCEVMLYKPDLI